MSCSMEVNSLLISETNEGVTIVMITPSCLLLNDGSGRGPNTGPAAIIQGPTRTAGLLRLEADRVACCNVEGRLW